MRKWSLLLLPLIAVLFSFGCHSTDYYREQAVERARAYLLDRTGDLSAEEVAYIRYNQPVLLVSDILGSPGSLEDSNISSAFSQICVTWILPERRDAYMVFGVSEGRMIEWQPRQLLIRKFVKTDTGREKAMSAARSYALNNMYYDLNIRQYNLVRFSDPEIIRTNFQLPLNSDGLLTPEEEAKLQAREQYSLVWPLPGRGDNLLIISGQSDASLAGWSVLAAGEYTQEDLKKHTVVETPAENKISAEKKAAAEPAAVPAADSGVKAEKQPETAVKDNAGEKTEVSPEEKTTSSAVSK